MFACTRSFEMANPRTGAERYIACEKQEPEFRAAHAEAERRIRQVDGLVRALDERGSSRG